MFERVQPSYVCVCTNAYKYVLGLYLYVLAQSWYGLELNLFEPVFQGMLVQEEFRLVQEEFRRSKSLRFILGHGREKTAFQRVFVSLLDWTRQLAQAGVQAIDAGP